MLGGQERVGLQEQHSGTCMASQCWKCIAYPLFCSAVGQVFGMRCPGARLPSVLGTAASRQGETSHLDPAQSEVCHLGGPIDVQQHILGLQVPTARRGTAQR